MICSLSFWGARARALSEKNCALSWYGAVWLPNFLDNNFPSVCFFRCDALILVVFDECKHWFADWLRKKNCCGCCSYRCCGCRWWWNKKKSKDDRYAVAAWLVLKMPGKYETHICTKRLHICRSNLIERWKSKKKQAPLWCEHTEQTCNKTANNVENDKQLLRIAPKWKRTASFME